jgi:hypothetical protein
MTCQAPVDDQWKILEAKGGPGEGELERKQCKTHLHGKMSW